VSVLRHFTAERESDVLCVALLRDVTGVDHEEVQADVAELLRQLASSGVRHAVVDFSAVAYFGSSTLEAILALWRDARSRGGRLAAYGLSDAAQQVLKTVRFDTLWPICTSRNEALAAVRVTRA
jgi:anti-anti-sigma factor